MVRNAVLLAVRPIAMRRLRREANKVPIAPAAPTNSLAMAFPLGEGGVGVLS